MSPGNDPRLTYRRLLAFFLPLGLSASLVTISHVIINGTLARSDHPELVIASYSVAMSLMGITERPAVLLRQTCSALVRDRVSFRAMSFVAYCVLACIVLVGALIAYSPLGQWIFLHFFGVEPALLPHIIQVYRVLMFVSIFSGIRCLYHGIIIFNLRTKWLTIGMGIRLVGMALLAFFFVATNRVTSGSVGAVLFLTGMMIECAVSLFEGRSLLRHTIPEKKEHHGIERKGQIFRFYRPLLYSSFIAVILGPAINAFLGKTGNMELAVASYALASSVAQLMQSFFSYMHQIVLNFYKADSRIVLRFAAMMGFFPGLLVALLAYTPAGPWFLVHVMGVQPGTELLAESLRALRVFMIMNLVFPWLDFSNGLVMLKGQTKIMVWSQAANVLVTLTTLIVLVHAAPGWNGRIGAAAASLGFIGEISVVLAVLRASSGPRSRSTRTGERMQTAR
jgi:hypothetical protein